MYPRYWIHVHPCCSVLDPVLHTITYVRERSHLLLTAILAAASIYQAALPGASAQEIDEAQTLYAHSEKLFLVISITGARSSEIIQGYLVGHNVGVTPL
jgi:hypothetical protein